MKKQSMATLGLLFAMLSFIGWMGARLVLDIQFGRNVEGYLKRAADANTVELAKDNLGIALRNFERGGTTEGYTSIWLSTPDEDVGFWYKNLTASYKELEASAPDATPLEKSNVLMKLRETLLDKSEHGEHVTTPKGIEIFPHNRLFCLWGLGSLVVIILCGGLVLKD